MAIEGWACSFVNNFKASAKGWGIPMIPTLFGPFRIWMYPRIFRSNKVKKAMANKIKMYVIRENEIEGIIIIKKE